MSTESVRAELAELAELAERVSMGMAGQIEALAESRRTRDWSNSGHGGPKRVIREDLRQ